MTHHDREVREMRDYWIARAVKTRAVEYEKCGPKFKRHVVRFLSGTRLIAEGRGQNETDALSQALMIIMMELESTRLVEAPVATRKLADAHWFKGWPEGRAA
jgi:hypothetical protein